MLATLYLKVLEFTTIFLFSLLPFQISSCCIHKVILFILTFTQKHDQGALLTNWSQLNIKSHCFQAVAHDCTFSIHSLSALHFDLTFGSCWPIQLIVLLLNTVASLQILPSGTVLYLHFSKSLALKNLEAYLVSPCLELNSFMTEKMIPLHVAPVSPS